MSDYDEKIWLQHQKEPDEQYKFFIRYYLKQNSDSRSVLMAYKLYMMAEHGKKEEDLKGNISYNRRYTHWSKGKNTLGEVIEGLHSWDERAKSYWEFAFKDELNLLIERRGRVVEDEFHDGEKLLQSWTDSYQAFLIQITDEKAEAIKRGINFDGSSMANRLQKFVKMRDEIAVFLRRTVGLTDRVTTDEVAKALTTQKSIDIEWYVPNKDTRVEDNDIDNMAEEDFEELVKDKLRRLSGERSKSVE